MALTVLGQWFGHYYVEKDVCTLGRIIKCKGILVVRDPADAATLHHKIAVLCILGMSVTKRFYEMEQPA